MHFHVVIGFSEVDRGWIDEPEIGHARDIGDVLSCDTLWIGAGTYRSGGLSGTHPIRNVVLLPLVNTGGSLPVPGFWTRSATIKNLQHARLTRRV